MALATRGGIEIEGMEALQRAISRSKDRELIKNMQEAHKQVGRFVVSRLSPRPVPEAIGAGRGSSVRVSGSRYSVQLKVGGKHREDGRGPDAPLEQWGARPVPQFGLAAARPYIIGTAEIHRDEIEDVFLEAVVKAFDRAFWKAETDG